MRPLAPDTIHFQPPKTHILPPCTTALCPLRSHGGVPLHVTGSQRPCRLWCVRVNV